ncbi:unnamed protein product [Urochloa humidicola]
MAVWHPASTLRRGRVDLVLVLVHALAARHRQTSHRRPPKRPLTAIAQPPSRAGRRRARPQAARQTIASTRTMEQGSLFLPPAPSCPSWPPPLADLVIRLSKLSLQESSWWHRP